MTLYRRIFQFKDKVQPVQPFMPDRGLRDDETAYFERCLANGEQPEHLLARIQPEFTHLVTSWLAERGEK